MEPVKRAVYMAIYADRWTDDFMIAADLFDPGKHVGYLHDVSISYKPDTELTFEMAALGIDHLRQALEYEGRNIVTLVHLNFVQSKNMIVFNDSAPPYFNPEVRIVSTGQQYYMLDDFLRHIGLKVETDQYRYIKAVNF